MVITSENKSIGYTRYGNTQFRYAMVYVLLTLIVLTILNLYCSETSQKLFCKSKEAAMVEKCLLASNEISGLDVLSPTTATAAVSQMGNLKVSRMIITNQSGLAVYDSSTADNVTGRYVLFPEIVQALNGNDTFTCHYRDGTMQSKAATPVLSYGTLIGSVYIMELDQDLGSLIQSLQYNIFSITAVLEIVVILFSLIYSRIFSNRLQQIMHSMRIIQEGDYSHKVNMGGHDELTFLGDEFNDLTERLQSSERKRSQFVSDASHELKTPLASIKLLSDSILQNDMDVETIREFVEDIGNEADRLNRMSQKLLSLSHIESQQDGECEIVSIAPTVKRVVQMLSGIAKANGITIETSMQEDYPILILEDDLYQIIFNLAENGIKYNTPSGKLCISLRRDEDNAMLQFSDTGVGIPEDALSHIFERFYRVDKARSRQSGGSGLGLAIVRNMVERNHGSIHVESTVGVGSTFTVVFPIFDTDEEDPQ